MAQPKNEYLPLTQMQRGIFVDSSAAVGDDPYVMQVMVDFAERLDYERLSRAVDVVANAHPAVRSCFRTRVSGEPVQVVVPAAHVPGVRDDLRHIEPGQVAERLEQIRQSDSATAFDLSVAPLMRFRLVDLPGDRQHLLFSYHHIVLDGWSVPPLVRDVLATYGGADPVAEFVFRDYVAWESHADAVAADEAFARVLEGFTSPSMIAEHILDPEPGERTIATDLPASETSGLTEWCRRREISLASVVEVCWAQSVALQTGRTDVAIGVMEANRGLGTPGIATAVGLFANVVPVRVALREEATVADICGELAMQRLATLPHRHLGLGRIQAANGGAPLFDTIVTFQNYRSSDVVVDGPGIHILDSRSHTSTTQPAMLAVIPGEALRVELTYRTEAVSAHRAQEMLDVFTYLLSSIPACADTPVRYWPLGPVDPQAGELAPRATRDDEPLLPALLLAAAKHHLDRIAVSTPTADTSFSELLDEASAVARWVIDEHGVGTGVVVAVAIRDDRLALAVRLGVMLAGATACVVRPSATEHRTQVVSREVNIDLVLADHAQAPRSHGREVVRVDDPPVVDAIRHHRGEPLPAVDITGTDEAVVTVDRGLSLRSRVTHRALADAVAEYADRLGIAGGDTLWASSQESVGLLAALTRGAHVVLGADATGETVVSLSHHHEITVLEGSAATLGRAVHLDPGVFSGRRVVVSGPPLTRSIADAILATDAEPWLAYAPGGELASLAPVRHGRSTPMIGAPLPGIRLRIIDPYGRNVPDGSLGEIAVVVDADVRRTGDLGRRTASGAIDYLGPVEQRLEIRGNRIEPWVIEEALTAFGGVVEAVVHRTDEARSQILVAHLAPATVDSVIVTEALRSRLPSYAIPNRVVTWPRLPRTADGSVDLDELTTRLDDGEASSENVDRLVALFAEITGAGDVGPHSDFFALGGDSLGVTRLRARAASRYGWELDLRLILELRTPAAISGALTVGRLPAPPKARDGDRSPHAYGDHLPRRAAESGREGALSGAQASLWLLNQLDAESSQYNLTLALDLHGDLDETAFAAAVDDVAERHEVLRTRYLLRAGAPVQRVERLHSDRPLLTIVDTPAETLDRVLAASAGRGFRLSEELPMRAELHRVAPGRATILFTFHHVAIDGASFLPFARDLGQAYDARRRGESPRFDANPVQYLDHVAWWGRRLGNPGEIGTLSARQASYWRGHLDGLVASTDIPVDVPRDGDGAASGRANRLLLAWGPDVRDAVGRIAQRAGSTRFAVYQTALAAAMHSLGAPMELALGVPVSGRPHVDLDDAIGNYANFVVSRVQLDPEESMSGNSARRGRALAGELDHQDLPFSEVVRAVRIPRQAGRNPLYQTALVLQSYEKPAVALHGIDVTERLMPVVDARLDLVVAVVEGGTDEGVMVSAEFAESAYRPGTVEMLADRFRLLLLGGAADPDVPVSRQLCEFGSATAHPSGDTRVASETEVAPARSAVSTSAGSSGAAVDDLLLAEVVAAYSTAIRFTEIDPDAGYFDAGGDSVGTVSVAAALAHHNVDIATLMTGPSAREITKRIVNGDFRDDAGSLGAGFAGVAAAGFDLSLLDPFSPLLPIRPAGDKHPLFTFHGGVGLSIPYTGLSTVIDSDVPIYGLQATDAIFGAEPPESLTEQVQEYLNRIREVQPRGPYRLLGWSYGGWAAHEVARLLEAEGDEVDLLVIIDSEAPSAERRSWGPDLPREAGIRILTGVLGIAGEDGSAITTDEELYAAFQRSGGAFAKLGSEDVGRFADAMQSHARLAGRHRPGTVSAPTVLVWSSASGTAHPSDLADEWAPYLAGPVSSFSLEAQHQFLMHPLPQRLIGTIINDLMKDPGRAVLLAEPRYREDLDFLDFLVESPPADEVPPADVEPPAGQPGAPLDETASSVRRSRLGDFLIETNTLVSRRLHHLRKTPWRLIVVALNPLILILAFGYLFAKAIVIPGYNGAYMSYLLAGVSAQAGLQNIGPTAIAIRADLDKGLFDRFRSLPMGRGVVLFAHSIADSIIGVASLIIVVLGGWLAGWRLGAGAIGFGFGLLILVVFIYVCVWLGIGVGLLVKNLESIESIGVALSVGLSFLSNALLAPGTLPGWLQPFAEWNPVSAVATSVRHAWGNPVGESASIAGRIPLLAAGIFCAIVLLVVPVLAQRRYGKGT